MTSLNITVLDPDTKQVQRAATHIRSLLKNKELFACVQEVTCYLEISRQGLTNRTPVIAVNGQNFQCKNLSNSLLEEFVEWLSKKLNE